MKTLTENRKNEFIMDHLAKAERFYTLALANAEQSDTEMMRAHIEWAREQTTALETILHEIARNPKQS